MRGRPLVEWLVFAAVWLLLLSPLRQVTGGRAAAARESVADLDDGRAPAAKGRAPVWVRLRFSEAPETFALHAGNELVWTEDYPDSEMEELINLATNAALELAARWGDFRRRVVELSFEPLEGTPWRRVLWIETQEMRERIAPE